MTEKIGFTHIAPVDASATVPPGGHLLYAEDTKKLYKSDGTTKTELSSGGGSYSDEQAQDAVGSMVDSTLVYTDATPLLSRAALTGDVTASAGSNATTIANDSVTYAKIQNVTDSRLLGRSAGSSGDVQEITVGSGLSLDSGGLSNVKRTSWVDYKRTSADTPDDDFNSGSLDAKWTVVRGSSGTVDLFSTGTTLQTYDLNTRSGWLMAQVGKNTGQLVQLRQDYALPDGKSIIIAIAVNVTGSSTDTPTNNSNGVSIILNDSDAVIRGGNWVSVGLDAEGTAPRIFSNGSAGSNLEGTTSKDSFGLGEMIYIRIARVGLVYHSLYTMSDGLVWHHMGSRTLGGAANNIWVEFSTGATMTGVAAIHGVDWIFQGTNSFDSW